MKAAKSQSLCLECGLCCNGVIFANGQLQPADNFDQLKRLGLRLKAKSRNAKFFQPCAAFQNCSCQIYKDRPTYCREFECALLKNVNEGKVEMASALRTVRTAHQRVERVRSLLRELGDSEESLALSKRFQRIAKKFHGGDTPLEERAAGIFGELTLAFHDLNLLLSQKFYPGR